MSYLSSPVTDIYGKVATSVADPTGSDSLAGSFALDVDGAPPASDYECGLCILRTPSRLQAQNLMRLMVIRMVRVSHKYQGSVGLDQVFLGY